MIRNGNVLLLREPQDAEFHLPGGGVEDGEPFSIAVERELCEETGLATAKADYLFEYCEFWATDGDDYWGQVHRVFSVKADGDVALSDEHCEFTWWNGESNVQLMDYVEPMLNILQGASNWRSQE